MTPDLSHYGTGREGARVQCEDNKWDDKKKPMPGGGNTPQAPGVSHVW